MNWSSIIMIIYLKNKMNLFCFVSIYSLIFRVCRGFRLNISRWLLCFGVTFNHFQSGNLFFWGSWGCRENQLEPKTLPLKSKFSLSKSLIPTVWLVVLINQITMNIQQLSSLSISIPYIANILLYLIKFCWNTIFLHLNIV